MSNIPENPVDNLNRVKSIRAGWMAKLTHKQNRQTSIERKLGDLRKLIASEQDSGGVEARVRKTIERKFLFDLDKLSKETRKLKSLIAWATDRQIPFLKQEVALYEAEQRKKSEQTSEDGHSPEDEVGGVDPLLQVLGNAS
jgi:hypothetical protein